VNGRAGPGLGERALLGLLAWCAVALILAEFLLLPFRTARLAPELTQALAPGVRFGSIAAADDSMAPLGPWWGSVAPHAWWALGLLLLWVAVPALLLRRAGPLPFTVGPPGTARGLALYGALVAVMLPLLWVVSGQAGFLRTYPMLRPEQAVEWSWRLLFLFWGCYATILFATEFLFRGVLLFALVPRLGAVAVAVSVMPYALIHVHKPLPEALGSIVAGFVLGALAFRTGSIGGGVLVHCAVAIGMDLLALLRTGRLPPLG
jgi:hypothetical protein